MSRRAAVRWAGPARAALVLQFYDMVESAGGTVWDCEPKFGELHCSVELLGGAQNPIWPGLEELIETANRTCEACAAPGHFANDLPWVRVLCDSHHQMFNTGAEEGNVFGPWWQRLLPERPDLWPRHD